MSNIRSFTELPVGTKVVRNAAFGSVRVLLITPIPLLLTPFIIRHVGIQGLGIWAVFIAINNLTNLADFGFLGTLTRHVSEHYTRKDYLQLNRILNSGIIMFLGISLLCVGTIVLGSNLVITAFFQHAPLAWNQMQHAVRWLGLAVGFNLLAFPFTSITTGLQRLDFSNGLSALNFIATAVLAALFLAAGSGIMGLAYAIVLSASLNLALSVGVSSYLLPEFKPSPRLIRFAEIKTLFSFSLQMYITQIAVAVNAHTEKFLLAYFSGLSPTGRYDVANDLSIKIRSVPSLLLSPLLPAATELDARSDQSRLMELYYRTHKYMAFLSVPLAALVGVMAHRFIDLWLGPGFSTTASALSILAAVHLFNLTCAPSALIFIAKGSLKPGVRSALYGIVSNLLVSPILIARWGFNGAVYGTSFSIVTATAYLIFIFHRETLYSTGRLFKAYLKPLLWAGFLGLFAAYMVFRIQFGWAGLVLTSLIFLAAYAIGLLLLHHFDAFDLEAIEKIMPLPKFLRRIVLFA